MARPMGAHAGVPAPLPAAVAVGAAVLGVADAPGHPGELGDLGLHHRFGHYPHALAQEAHIAIRGSVSV